MRWLTTLLFRMKTFHMSRVRLVTLLALLLLTTIYIMIMNETGTNKLRDAQFLQLDACPACYGRKMCNAFHSGAIKFTGVSRIPSLHFLNVKNVHRAVYKGNSKIVLKKLAHNRELAEADDNICSITRQPKGCHSGDSLFRHKFDAEEVLHPATVKGLSDLVACPSPRLLERMADTFMEKEEYLLHSEKLMIYTTLLINPEPLVLQMFPSREGWPFPQYYGACGRWVAVEDIPNPLIDYVNHDFLERVKLAKQILEIADRFTTDRSEFALYWTDVDYDNYAVRDDGRVVIVDAENVVVVDKQKLRQDKPPNYTEPLYSRYDQCKPGHNCLSYAPDLLCQRLESDLNYYAVCRGILAPDASEKDRPNLLHSVPGHVDDHWELTDLLNQCSHPTYQNSRFLTKSKLLTALGEIIQGSPL